MSKDTRLPSSDDQLLHRIRAEYLEMPGLRLTRPQAQRLWGLDDMTCGRLLDVLVDLKFLARRPDGQFIRTSEGGVPRLTIPVAKADIRPRPRPVQARVDAHVGVR
jgi:hypothetical protein